jgi:lipoyl(octanoyl) transferase
VTTSPEVWVVRAGQIEYQAAREVQKRLETARLQDVVPDLLLLLEHPPVYTKGRRTTPDELPMGEDWYRMQGIQVEETDRGGRVTYHGPGQLVGYPIVSLRPYRDDVHDYIRRMERVIVESLAAYHIDTGPIEGLTGVWTGDRRKIASIGVHVNRGVTTHGFAINVNNDLQPFEWIVPCGIDYCQMSSVCRELGAAQDMDACMDTVAERFGEVYDRAPVPTEAADVAKLAAGLDDLVAAPRARVGAGNGRPAQVALS